MQGLELRDIVWESAGRHELDEESVQIARGSHAVVVAEPAVATALADVLCGLARPVRGRILAGDTDVTAQDPNPEHIALVPVGGGLLPHLTVAKNIEFNLDPRGSRSARADQVNDLARDLQLLGALRRVPHALTPEQRMRVAVARALARHPSALVVEDRAGEEATCEQAVRLATAQSVAVLVLTDSPVRAAALSSHVHTARPLRPDPPPPPPQEARPEPRREAEPRREPIESSVTGPAPTGGEPLEVGLTAARLSDAGLSAAGVREAGLGEAELGEAETGAESDPDGEPGRSGRSGRPDRGRSGEVAR